PRAAGRRRAGTASSNDRTTRTRPEPTRPVRRPGAWLRQHDGLALLEAARDLGHRVIRDAEGHVRVDGLAVLEDLHEAATALAADRQVGNREDALLARDDHVRRAAHPRPHLRVRDVDGDVHAVDRDALLDRRDGVDRGDLAGHARRPDRVDGHARDLAELELRDVGFADGPVERVRAHVREEHEAVRPAGDVLADLVVDLRDDRGDWRLEDRDVEVVLRLQQRGLGGEDRRVRGRDVVGLRAGARLLQRELRVLQGVLRARDARVAALL